MDWESISKRLAKTGREMSGKVKEKAEEVQLKQKKASVMAELDEIYAQIGRVLCKYHEEDIPEELEEMWGDAQKLEEEILKYQSSIYMIRGVKVCTSCGAELPKDAAFCQKCGTPVPEEEDEEEPEEEFEEESTEDPLEDIEDTIEKAAEQAVGAAREAVSRVADVAGDIWGNITEKTAPEAPAESGECCCEEKTEEAAEPESCCCEEKTEEAAEPESCCCEEKQEDAE